MATGKLSPMFCRVVVCSFAFFLPHGLVLSKKRITLMLVIYSLRKWVTKFVFRSLTSSVSSRKLSALSRCSWFDPQPNYRVP